MKYVDAGEESNVIFRVVLVNYVDAGEESNLIFRVAKQCTDMRESIDELFIPRIPRSEN